MNTKNLSRREFLRVSALTAAGLVAAQCGAPATPAPPAATEAPKPAATEAPTTAPPAAKEVTIDVVTDLPEYEAQFRQIYDVFMEENPGVTVTLATHSEDGIPAFQAKIAGGYLPAMERTPASIPGGYLSLDNYKNFVDLSTIDFPYFDNWTYPVKTMFTDVYGVSGPRSLDPFEGYEMTWMYHEDLLTPAGLNPRERNIKTWEELKQWLDDGTKWAQNNDAGVTMFWDQALLAPWWDWVWMDIIPTAYADGQREFQRMCWMGEKAFNAEDSPYRRTYDFAVEAYDKGWLPKNFWTRQWEPDMETSFGNKKSAVMLHGPWPWDKTLGIDPNAKQQGFPATPPAEGMAEWVQFVTAVEFDKGYIIREGNQNQPNWEVVRKFFIWWNSPEVIPMRVDAEGRVASYKLDPPHPPKGAQYEGIVKEIGLPSGVWPSIKLDSLLPGNRQVYRYFKAGTPGVWDWESGNIAQIWEKLLTKEMTVQDVLDLNQKNWEMSYPELAAK
jgi:ABC-type glycerol-3-phosphate transport system substrate-binding protein